MEECVAQSCGFGSDPKTSLPGLDVVFPSGGVFVRTARPNEDRLTQCLRCAVLCVRVVELIVVVAIDGDVKKPAPGIYQLARVTTTAVNDAIGLALACLTPLTKGDFARIQDFVDTQQDVEHVLIGFDRLLDSGVAALLPLIKRVDAVLKMILLDGVAQALCGGFCLALASRFLHKAVNWQRHTSEGGDDDNYHQEFDKGEALRTMVAV